MTTYGGTTPPPPVGPGPIAATSLATLWRLVRERIGIPTSDDFMTNDVLTDQINMAMSTLDTEQRWPWMEMFTTSTLAAGSNTLLLPADWRATRALFNGRTELALVAPEDLMPFLGAGGAPGSWTVTANGVLVAPAPSSDTVLSHYYYRQTYKLSADTDVCGVPDQYIDAVVCKAAELLSAREDDTTARAAHAADYERWVARMRRDVRKATGPTIPRVRAGSWI